MQLLIFSLFQTQINNKPPRNTFQTISILKFHKITKNTFKPNIRSPLLTIPIILTQNPRMIQRLLSSQPLTNISFQKPLHKIPPLLTNILPPIPSKKSLPICPNISQNTRLRPSIIRRHPRQQNITNHTYRPYITLLIILLVYHLWCHIISSTYTSIHLTSLLKKSCCPEIYQT